jgi:hypothetical protein
VGVAVVRVGLGEALAVGLIGVLVGLGPETSVDVGLAPAVAVAGGSGRVDRGSKRRALIHPALTKHVTTGG